MTDIGQIKIDDLLAWAETANSDHLRDIAERLIECAILRVTDQPRAAIILLGIAGRFEALAIVPRGTSLTSC